MSDLPERLTDLADSLDACEWNHPLGSADAVRLAVDELAWLKNEVARLTAARDEMSERLQAEIDELRNRDHRAGQWQERGP